MKILIVEDDNFKMDAIRRILSGVSNAHVVTATSLRNAMIALDNGEFDVVVLDMAIPSHTSEVGAIDTYSQPVGGLDVLLFLSSNKRAERVTVLTQYPTVEYDRRHVPLKELVCILHKDGVTNIVAAVLFTENGDWGQQLLSALGTTK